MSRSSFLKVVGVVSAFVLATTLAALAQQLPPALNTVHTFNSTSSPDGINPYGSLIQLTAPSVPAIDGSFYGTTYYGGRFNEGTVYQLTPGGVHQVIHDFTSFQDGNWPQATLLQASDGNLYGSTTAGGNDGGGTIFSINPQNGALIAIHGFSTQPPDGNTPTGALVQDTSTGPLSGLLIGTTSQGGLANSGGTLFAISTSGRTYNILYDFCSQPGCTDGKTPQAGVLEDSLGNFYGTTASGGAFGFGVVWEYWLNPATGAYQYVKLNDLTSVTGASPAASLVFGPPDAGGDPPNNGYLPLYGTATTGGAHGGGTVFQVTPCVLPPDYLLNLPCPVTPLYAFGSPTDGAKPEAPLVLASDGYFYGTTSAGGAFAAGTIFRMDNAGQHYRMMYSFTAENDGADPYGGLIQATNGYFYGTARDAGADGAGTAFILSLAQRFVPMVPCRLLDTRTTGTPLTGGVTSMFNLRQLALDNNCGDLSNANSYALNVTVVPNGTPVNFATIWPANTPCLEGFSTVGGVCMPVASTLNSPNGVVKASDAIVQGGWDDATQTAGAAISIFFPANLPPASNTTDVLLDLQGYFTDQQSVPSGPSLQFYPLTPCRVADTRQANGPLGGPSLIGNVPRQFPMLINDECFGGIFPPGAYSLNVTATDYPLFYLTVWSGGDPQPNVSNLNNPQGLAVANATLVAPGDGADGPIKVYAYNNTNLILDVNGYFDPPGANGQTGNDFYPGLPCRSIDTRPNPFTGTLGAQVASSSCSPYAPLPAAYELNATVVPASAALGYLTLWPSGTTQPNVSTLNSYDGSVTTNMAIVPNTASVGIINAFAAGETNMMLDLGGYFAPSPASGGGTLLVKGK